MKKMRTKRLHVLDAFKPLAFNTDSINNKFRLLEPKVLSSVS